MGHEITGNSVVGIIEENSQWSSAPSVEPSCRRTVLSRQLLPRLVAGIQSLPQTTGSPIEHCAPAVAYLRYHTYWRRDEKFVGETGNLGRCLGFSLLMEDSF